MTKCPDCGNPLEYNRDAEKYYCPKCEKHWEPVEVEQRKTIYQDTTDNPTPDTVFYWDEHAREHKEEDAEEAEE